MVSASWQQERLFCGWMNGWWRERVSADVDTAVCVRACVRRGVCSRRFANGFLFLCRVHAGRILPFLLYFWHLECMTSFWFLALTVTKQQKIIIKIKNKTKSPKKPQLICTSDVFDVHISQDHILFPVVLWQALRWSNVLEQSWRSTQCMLHALLWKK